MTGENACDSSETSNCVSCPLGKSTFDRLLNLPTAGTYTGTFQQYNFATTAAENLVIIVDGGTTTIKSLSANCDTAAACITAIGTITGAVVSLSGNNILITSSTKGTSSEISIDASSGPNAKKLFTNPVPVLGSNGGYVGNVNDCTVCSSGRHYLNPQKSEGKSEIPIWENGNCATCPLSTYYKTLAATKDILKFRCDTCPHGYGHTVADKLTYADKETKDSACLDYTTETCPLGQIGVIAYDGGDCSAKDGIANVADSSNCTTCPPNTYTFGNQRICTSCPAGKVIPADVDIHPSIKNFTLGLLSPLNSTMRQGNPAHHFSPDACSIDVEESEVGTCSGGVEAQEYDLGLDEVGSHWITFLQNPNYALQLGTW